MAEYWAREEKVEAFQYLGTEKSLEEVILWCCELNNQGIPLSVGSNVSGSHYSDIPLKAWMDDEQDYRVHLADAQRVEAGDYIVVSELNELIIMSEREFTKRYYRRSL